MQAIGLLLKVLWSPGEAMFLISKKPRVIVPILFLQLSSLIAALIVQTKASFGELYMNMLLRSPQAARMPEETRAQLQRVMSLPVIQWVYIGSAIVIPILFVLLIAAIYFGAFSVVGREGGFKAFFSITAFSFVPLVFSQLATVVRSFTILPSSLMLDEMGSLSLGTFIDRDSSPLLFATLNSIDLVTIWVVILLTIGYGFVTSKSVSKGMRTGITVGVFLVYEAIKLAFVALRGL